MCKGFRPERNNRASLTADVFQYASVSTNLMIMKLTESSNVFSEFSAVTCERLYTRCGNK